MSINCNDCKYINITEEEQDMFKDKEPHICNFYKERIYHNRREGNYIFPCKQCVEDSYKNYEYIDSYGF